jgi:hypothetical protein
MRCKSTDVFHVVESCAIGLWRARAYAWSVDCFDVHAEGFGWEVEESGCEAAVA